MSVGPPDDPKRGSAPDGGEDFDWLYGKDSSGTADDATRLIPKMQRPGTPQAPVPAQPPMAPAGPPITPGANGRILPAPGGPKPPRIRIKWKRVILLFVVLPLVAWLVFLIAVPLTSWNSIHRVNPWPSGARPAAGAGTNYLLVGTDSRRGLNAKQRQILGLGNVAEDSGRTDTIMILHVGSGAPMLISIPRDSAFKVPGYGGPYKINSTFNPATYPGGHGLTIGGPKLLVKTIETDLGIRIDHYVEIGFGAFVNAVDAVGGVQICPTSNLNDHNADLHVKKGCQNANGAVALAWSRSRDAFRLGDLARAAHQRLIVKEVGAKVKSIWTFVLPWRYLDITDAAVQGLTVDNTMSIWNMISMARAMSSVKRTCTLPLTAFSTPLPVNWSAAHQLMTYFINDDTNNIPTRLCSPTGLAQ